MRSEGIPSSLSPLPPRLARLHDAKVYRTASLPDLANGEKKGPFEFVSFQFPCALITYLDYLDYLPARQFLSSKLLDSVYALRDLSASCTLYAVC